jgi:hypothetical protein
MSHRSLAAQLRRMWHFGLADFSNDPDGDPWLFSQSGRSEVSKQMWQVQYSVEMTLLREGYRRRW